jgi:hypothetical protein
MAVAALLLAAGAYVIAYGKVSSLATEAATVNAELEARSTSGASRLAEEELAANEARIYGHFVNENDIVPFLEELEAIGDTLGADVKVESVNKPKLKADQPQYLEIALTISGPFSSVVRTLGAIEYQPYDTKLVELTLDSPDAGQGWMATVTFRVGTGPKAAQP